MCGIVGYIGTKSAKPILLEGLKRLEYRGYDSAGISILEKDKVVTTKAVGKVVGLEKKIKKRKLTGTIGIAHTRWATHGKPSEVNSHPHSDCGGRIFVVHNGIIENYASLREGLIKKGHKFRSETDTKVVAHLIEEVGKKEKDFFKSVKKALKLLVGTYGLVVLNKDNPNKLIIARNGSPLILGVGKEEYIIASDASAILAHTDKVVYLNDGDVVQVNLKDFEICNILDKKVDGTVQKVEWSIAEAQKKGFKHFMLKEIFEQPQAVEDAIRGRVSKLNDRNPILGGLKQVEDKLRKIKRIILVSCGTSYHASLVGKYMLEEYAGVVAEVECASEFRYRNPLMDKDSAVLVISQSGETADTLEAIREAKNKGILTLGIVNVVGSTIARETDAGIYNHAGPEIGVASTKAFVSQLSVLILITLMLGRQRNLSYEEGKKIAQELTKVPQLIKKILDKSSEIEKIMKEYEKFNNYLYLGRKYNYPIALEGALKIKEISYIHAEGYPAGEMKHGPIAMIDRNFPSLFLAPTDSVYDKMKSAIEEIKARDGKIIAIATEGNKEIKNLVDDVIYIPKTLEVLTPLISVVPLQLMAYYAGVLKKIDVDKPRNLAKSVTVE